MHPRFIHLLAAAGFALTATLASAQADFRSHYARPAGVPAPADNVSTPERIELGKMLFFDPRLSGTEAMSCASCHNPSLSWTDPLPVARGEHHVALGRRTPTILNSAFNVTQMWDGRFASLEEQALGPMTSPAEMHAQPAVVEARLNAIPRYRELFRSAYNEPVVTIKLVAKAIAAFERTVVSGEAPFDRFVRGDDQAISTEAKRGFTLFNTKAQCATCHSGWNFSDGSFHDIGIASEDKGRGPIIGLDDLDHAFKTPTLRNIAERAPYGHNGSEATLRDIVDLYNQGGRVKRSTLSQTIKPLGLDTAEQNDLVAFLRTLTSDGVKVTLPDLPGNDSGPKAAVAEKSFAAQ